MASERSFSGIGQRDTINHNHTDPVLFGYTQILKNAYKTDLLGVAVETKGHEPSDWIDVDI